MDFLAFFLEHVNSFANLTLVVVTTVYVILTWRMVREMRQAREAELEPHLVAAIVPLAPVYAEIRITNAGQGPALNVRAVFSVIPEDDTLIRRWNYPILTSGCDMDFFLPSEQKTGALPTLRDLANEYESVVISLRWESILGRERKRDFEYSLDDQIDGWYNAGRVIPPDDLPMQMKNIRDELKKSHEELRNLTRELRTLSNSAEKLSETALQRTSEPKSKIEI